MHGPDDWLDCFEQEHDKQVAFCLASSDLDWIELSRTSAGAAELLEEHYREFDTRVEKRGSRWHWVSFPEGLLQLCELARGGDTVADKVIREKAARAIEEGRLVPTEIKEYIVSDLRLPRPGKRGRPSQRARNMKIASAVSHLQEVGGYQRYRGDTSTSKCACSIVADMLAKRGIHMTVKRVSEIVGDELPGIRKK